jgi:hypothetical protein
MVTDPKKAGNLFDKAGELTGFGKEIKHLEANGYIYDELTKMMVKR